MAQRVRKSHRGQCPSSATQLPILAALHARYPTLFRAIIHDVFRKVNIFFAKTTKKCKKIGSDRKTAYHDGIFHFPREQKRRHLMV